MFFGKNTLFRWKEEKTNTSRGGLAFLWLMRLVNLSELEEKVENFPVNSRKKSQTSQRNEKEMQ
jgi:hypothetical protein